MSAIPENYYAHPSCVIDENCQIGAGTHIWHFSHLMSGSVIGEKCTIGQNVFVASGVVVGNGCKIQNNVSLYAGVRCENNVFIGPSVVFTNVINPRAEFERKSEYKQTLICEGASIGANATIVCGHTLGKGCFVGAGSVVIKDVGDYELVVGVPARRIGWISRFGEKLRFDANGKATCPHTHETYVRTNNTVRIMNEENMLPEL